MILTADEYRRGLLSWHLDTESNITIACTETQDGVPQWSEPLTDPKGSKAPVEPGNYTHVSIGVADRSALQRPFQIRWERTDENGIVTRIWDNDITQPPVTLRHIPNYGLFHRLVVFAPYLVWADAPVVRVDDVVVRFINGRVVGEHAEPPSEVRLEGHIMTVAGQAGTDVAEGRFIEIVTPGETQALARQQAYTLLA